MLVLTGLSLQFLLSLGHIDFWLPFRALVSQPCSLHFDICFLWSSLLCSSFSLFRDSPWLLPGDLIALFLHAHLSGAPTSQLEGELRAWHDAPGSYGPQGVATHSSLLACPTCTALVPLRGADSTPAIWEAPPPTLQTSAEAYCSLGALGNSCVGNNCFFPRLGLENKSLSLCPRPLRRAVRANEQGPSLACLSQPDYTLLMQTETWVVSRLHSG